ncbi:MAG: hypothetical protein K0R09_565 [Clostridiales bacterium]|nr:hypothetical protein [Clostridiales bacterium]
MQSKIARKVLSGILSVSLMLQMGMPAAYASENNPVQETKTITAFAALAEDAKNITVPMGTLEDELSLPETVTATVERTVYEEVTKDSGNLPKDESDKTEISTTTGTSITLGEASLNSGSTGETQPKADLVEKKVTENVNLSVTWESDKPFSSETADTFTYTAKLTDESYILSEGVAIPQIKVQVNDSSKWAFKQSKIIDGIEITVKAEKGVFPEGATLHAEKVTNVYDNKKIEDAVNKEVKAENTTKAVEKLISFDITITDAEGNELQPDTGKGEVKILFAQLPMAKENTTPSQELKVFHMDDSLESAKGLETTMDQTSGTVEAPAEHFTVYTMASLMNNNLTQEYAASVTIDGDTKNYNAFLEAFNAANSKSGSTLKLLKNIEDNSMKLTLSNSNNMTLDLNGFTLKRLDDTNKQPVNFITLYSGSLTITDSSESKQGVITNVQAYGMNSTISVQGTGVLNLQQGTINSYIGISADINATINIQGGAVKGSYSGIYTSGSSTLDVTGGSISGRAGISLSGNATAEISGGEIRCDSYGLSIESTNATLRLTGGKFFKGSMGSIYIQSTVGLTLDQFLTTGYGYQKIDASGNPIVPIEWTPDSVLKSKKIEDNVQVVRISAITIESPQDKTVVQGNTPITLSIKALYNDQEEAGMTYKWHKKADGDANFSEVLNEGGYSGENTATLTIPVNTLGRTLYRCTASYNGTASNSRDILVTVIGLVASVTVDGTTTNFTNLMDAFASVGQNKEATITLLDDISSASHTWINVKNNGVKIMLNMNGHTINHNGENVYMGTGSGCNYQLTIFGGGTISNTGGGKAFSDFLISKITLEDVTILGDMVSENGTVVVNCGTIIGTGSHITAQDIYFDTDSDAITSGNTWYSITDTVEATKGSISYDTSIKTYENKRYIAKDGVVTFTVTPANSAVIANLPIVAYGKNQPVSVTKINTEGYGIPNQALKFSFIMPSKPVSIAVPINLPNTIKVVGSGISKVYDGTARALSTTKDEHFTWNGTGTATIDGYYTDPNGTATTIENSGAASNGGAPVNVGTYYAKVTVASDDTYLGTTAYIPFTIVQSGTIFDGGIKTYKDNTETNNFTYGDTITVKVMPKATGTASKTNGLMTLSSFAEPKANQMALFVGDTQITEPKTVTNGQELIFTYNTTDKGLKIDSNIITAKYVGNNNMANYSDTVTITLNKKTITSAVVNTSDVSASKEYDGSNNFTGIALTLSSSDILSVDKVTATAKGTVTDANVGEDKALTITSVTLNGDNKDYYSLDNSAVSGNVSITQATITGVNQELQIVKGLAKEYTFDLANLLPALSDGKSFGDITYKVENVTNTDNVLAPNPANENIVNGKITLKAANMDVKDKTATVQINVKSTNYKDFTADLTVKTIDKTPLTIEAVFTGGTYNGKPYAYTGTPTFKNGEETLSGITCTAKYVGRDGTTYEESETAPTNAGKYNLILTVSGESANTYAGTTTIGFEITKKQITAKPNDASIQSNASFPAYTWSIDTGIAGETITAANAKDVVMEAQENGKKLDAVKVGTFDIVFTTAPVFNQKGDIEKNYDIQMGKGKLTVTQYNPGGGTPSGGGSSSGSGSSSSDKKDSDTTVITPPAITEILNPPTKATATIPSTVTNGTANVTLSQSTVADAISKAQAEAKKNGTEENGIAVEIKVDTKNNTPSSLSANLPKVSVDALVKAEVKDVCISSGAAAINLNLETLKTIQKEIDGDVTVSAKKVDNSTLSAEAKALVGNRPVFDFSITGTNGKKVTDFGKGMVSVSIPYTLGANEKAGNVVAYYIDNEGKVQEIPNSVYDEKTKTLMFTTNHFSQYAAGYKEDKVTTFTDIANHWAKEVIEFVTARGLLGETEKGKFSPDGAMTRGMFVTALGRLAEVDVSSYKTSKFTDVKVDSCYLPYIEWSNKNGILKGATETTFAPDQSITREQMAVIMTDYAKVMGFELLQVHAGNTFADNANVGSDAKTAVKQMQIAGVLTGKNSNVFDPQGTTTRAEVSGLLKRFAELVINRNTAEGWLQNDSGSLLYYKEGKALTGKQTIDGVSYEFNQYGETILKPSSTAETNTPKVENNTTKVNTNTTQKDKTNTVKKPAYKTYTVKKGDCFWSIARKFKVNIYTLLKLNNKSISSIIRPGTVLKIPQK